MAWSMYIYIYIYNIDDSDDEKIITFSDLFIFWKKWEGVWERPQALLTQIWKKKKYCFKIKFILKFDSN
jgi:hypothetical protein